MAKTSLTHPLQIAWIRPFDSSGRIGVTFCPGKKQSDGLNGEWDRDLALDLDLIADEGVTAVLTLVETSELAALGVEPLGNEVRGRGMAWFHAPIRDYRVPCTIFEGSWRAIGPELGRRVVAGEDILMHCKGGLGRAGTIAARLLVELGFSPDRAIKEVRYVRPGAIETAEQEEHVRACRPI